MEFDKFLDNLPRDDKTVLLSIAVIFPMAYIDCWKISSGFVEIELLKQVILAVGISVMLMMGGYILDLGYQMLSGYHKFIDHLNLQVIVMPPAFATASIIWAGRPYILSFLCFYGSIVIAGLGLALIIGVRAKKRQEKDGIYCHQENDTSDTSADPYEDETGDKHY